MPAYRPTITFAGSADLLDFGKLAELEGLIGARSTYGLLEILKQELQNRPATIQQLVDRDDRPAVMLELHALKGGAMNVGAVSVGDIASQMEVASQRGEPLAILASSLGVAAHATCALIDDLLERSAS